MGYTPTTWVNDGLPDICETTLNNIEDGIVDAQSQLVAPTHLIRVASNYTDDTDALRFNTIGKAITHALTLLNPVVDFDEAVVIKVAPGKYTEHITEAHRRIYIVSETLDLENFVHDVIIYNTGADAAHYPIDIGDDNGINLIGISVQTAVGGTYGKLCSRMVCSACRFDYGSFIEDLVSTKYLGMYFNNCMFSGDAFNLTGATTYGRFIAFRGCGFNPGTNVFGSGALGNSVKTIKLENCRVYGDLDIAGNWSMLTMWTEQFGTSKLTFDTAGYIDFFGNIIHNGIHFYSDPAGYKSFVNCVYYNTPAGETDITADVDITDVTYTQNVQDHGLPGEFQHCHTIKHVGNNHVDRYDTLQHAVDSVATGCDGTIQIHENQVALPEITIPATASVTIDAQRKYTLTFTGDIVEIGADQTFILARCAEVSGGNIEINGNNASLIIEASAEVVAYLTLTSGTGSTVMVQQSHLHGTTGHPAVTANTVDTLVTSAYSCLKGATGHPAISYSVVAINKLKAKFSTLRHGDGAANEPVVYTGVSINKIDISVYATAMNALWDVADFTNLIGSAGNITDAGIDF